MSTVVIADAGPLVAYLDRRDRHHAWAVKMMQGFTESLWTCEAVLSEAAFLLRRGKLDVEMLMILVERGALRLPLNLEKEAAHVRKLLRRYGNVPMSLADACLVRLAEQRESVLVFTCDSDFSIYRRHGRRPIPVLMPEF